MNAEKRKMEVFKKEGKVRSDFPFKPGGGVLTFF